MNKCDSVIFDLDGTLWDTCVACAQAWNNVLKRHHISFRPILADDVRKVTGKPHEICIRETFAGLPEHQLQLLITETMEEDNLIVSIEGGHIYEGVDLGLKILAQKFPLFIVSNCQSGYIETFLKLNKYESIFKDIECWGNTGKSKSENLAQIILRNNLKNPLYIGDAEGDRVAARHCKIPFYFVDYGFGNVQDYDARFSHFTQLSEQIITSF